MGVPKEIREVERPTNTIVCDNGKDTPFRYAVRERAASGKYVRGKFPQPKNGKVIGHIINFKYVLPSLLLYEWKRQNRRNHDRR